MGLSKAALRFLAREHRRRPFRGDWLMLGRQCVYATYADFLAICAEEGVAPAPLPPTVSRETNVTAWRGTPHASNTSDEAVFRTLGADSIRAFDYSDFEGAEIIGDLNQPVASELVSRFDGILDSGTLEHVFDVRTALMNVGRMLRPGGRVIHMSPCNSYANHGFYQFSPTLLLDYYAANGFRDVRAFVAEERGRDYQTSSWDLLEIDPRRQPVLMMSTRRLLLIGIAEKTVDATVEAVPLQSYYRQLLAAPSADEHLAPSPPPGVLAAIKRLLPVRLKTLLRTCLCRDPRRKPWGATPRGRLR